jgi:hypothetical protein
MKIPHKWPGKKKLMVLCAAMRMIDTVPLAAWDKVAGSSANTQKKWWSTIRSNMRLTIELHEKTHQQIGKDNG